MNASAFDPTTGANVPIPASLLNPAASSLTTVGASSLTAALIASGSINRGGSQAGGAFTDTIVAAAGASGLIAGLPLSAPAASFIFTYANNTKSQITIAGGTGTTVPAGTVVPPNSSITFLVARTGAATVTVSVLSAGFFPKRGTFTATSTSAVTVADTRVTAFSQITFTMKTAAGTPVSQPYIDTITAGTGFTTKAGSGDTSVYNYEIRG